MNFKKIKIIIIVFLILVVLTLISFITKKLSNHINYNEKVDEIMADNVEIEKKWLINVDEIPYNLSNSEKIKIEQTYINFSPEIRVRRINDGEQYTFAVKANMSNDGMIRDEMELNITEEEYNNLLQKKEGNTITKTRYQFLDGDFLLAVDLFDGNLKGLAYLEIEFKNKEEAEKFQKPTWIIKDVTADLNYKNAYLARFGIPASFFKYFK